MTTAILPGPTASALDVAAVGQPQRSSVLFAMRGAGETAWFFSADDCTTLLPATTTTTATTTTATTQDESSNRSEAPPPPPSGGDAAPPPPSEEAQRALKASNEKGIDIQRIEQQQLQQQGERVILAAGCRGLYTFHAASHQEEEEHRAGALHGLLPIAQVDTQLIRCRYLEASSTTSGAAAAAAATATMMFRSGRSVDILALACSADAEPAKATRLGLDAPVSLTIPWNHDETAPSTTANKELCIMCSVATATAIVAVILAAQQFHLLSPSPPPCHDQQPGATATAATVHDKLLAFAGSERAKAETEKSKNHSNAAEHSSRGRRFVPALQHVLFAFGQHHDERKQQQQEQQKSCTRDNNASNENDGNEAAGEKEKENWGNELLPLFPDPTVTEADRARFLQEAVLRSKLSELSMLESATRRVILVGEEQERNGTRTAREKAAHAAQEQQQQEEEEGGVESLSPMRSMHLFVTRYADTVHDPAVRGVRALRADETVLFQRLRDDFSAGKRRIADETAARNLSDLLLFEERLHSVALERDLETLVVATEPAARLRIHNSFYVAVSSAFVAARRWLDRAAVFWRDESAGRMMTAANERRAFGEVATEFAWRLHVLVIRQLQQRTMLLRQTHQAAKRRSGDTATTDGELAAGEENGMRVAEQGLARRASVSPLLSPQQKLQPLEFERGSKAAEKKVSEKKSVSRSTSPSGANAVTSSSSPSWCSTKRQTTNTERKLFSFLGHATAAAAVHMTSTAVAGASSSTLSPSSAIAGRSASAASVHSYSHPQQVHSPQRQRIISSSSSSNRRGTSRSPSRSPPIFYDRSTSAAASIDAAAVPPTQGASVAARGLNLPLKQPLPSRPSFAGYKGAGETTPRPTQKGKGTTSASSFSGRAGYSTPRQVQPQQQQQLR